MQSPIHIILDGRTGCRVQMAQKRTCGLPPRIRSERVAAGPGRTWSNPPRNSGLFIPLHHERLQGSPYLHPVATTTPTTTRPSGQEWRHDTPFPYADGLCFLADDDEVQASGLSTFICDVSAGAMLNERGEEVDTANLTVDTIAAMAPEDRPTRMVRTYNACARSTQAARERLSDPTSKCFLAEVGADVAKAFASGRTAVVLQFQGCDPIESDLGRMDDFYEGGIRVLQIVHHGDNSFGGGCMEPRWTGLTQLGREGVERMNELGIIPDLSHAADPTSLDVLETSRRPVIISHTGPRALVSNARCAPDAVIRGVAESGGVVGLFMMSFWVTSDEVPTSEAWVRSLRHLIDVAGIDHVAVANDFSLRGEVGALAVDNDNSRAIEGYYPWWDAQAANGILGFESRPKHVVFPEFNSIDRMYRIHDALTRNGFSATDIEKVMGGNWVRVLSESL